MKIGYFCNITNWKKKPYKQILDEARDIAVYCDKKNWDSIWFTEHHFNHEGMEACPIRIFFVLAAMSVPSINGFGQDSIPSWLK